MSASNPGISAWRCSQVSACRGGLPRCRTRSSVPVTAAVPGTTVLTAVLTRSARDSARCRSDRCGWAVTFSRGTSLSTPPRTPRNAQIRSRTRAGLSISAR